MAEQSLMFGTYDVPPISNDNLTASFTVPGNVPKDMIDKVIVQEDQIQVKIGDLNNFDKMLKSILSVPKPE